MSILKSINFDAYVAQLNDQLELYGLADTRATLISLARISHKIAFYDVRVAAAALFVVSEVHISTGGEDKQERVRQATLTALPILKDQMQLGNSLNADLIKPQRYDANPKETFVADAVLVANIQSAYFSLVSDIESGRISLKTL